MSSLKPSHLCMPIFRWGQNSDSKAVPPQEDERGYSGTVDALVEVGGLWLKKVEAVRWIPRVGSVGDVAS